MLGPSKRWFVHTSRAGGEKNERKHQYRLCESVDLLLLAGPLICLPYPNLMYGLWGGVRRTENIHQREQKKSKSRDYPEERERERDIKFPFRDFIKRSGTGFTWERDGCVEMWKQRRSVGESGKRPLGKTQCSHQLSPVIFRTSAHVCSFI